MPTRRLIIDHLKIGVSHLERSRAFVPDPDAHNVEAVFHG